MLWLIWIGMMLAVPVFAGLDVWRRLQREARQSQATPTRPEEIVSA